MNTVSFPVSIYRKLNLFTGSLELKVYRKTHNLHLGFLIKIMFDFDFEKEETYHTWEDEYNRWVYFIKD